MKPIRRTASTAMTAVLLLAAAAALAGWGVARIPARPPEIAFVFPASAPAESAVVRLRSCTTIEEAMLFKVMGVVENLASGPLVYPVAHVEFRDANGLVLDRSQGCVVPEVLESRRDGRFVLVTSPDPRIAAISVTLAGADGLPLPADYARGDLPQGFVLP